MVVGLEGSGWWVFFCYSSRDFDGLFLIYFFVVLLFLVYNFIERFLRLYMRGYSRKFVFYFVRLISIFRVFCLCSAGACSCE